MSIQSQLEREEEALEEAYARGEISSTELREQMRELQRDYRSAAQESAMDAYDAEMDRW